MKSITTFHSSTSRRSIARESPKCKHGVLAKLQTARKGSRVGHRFYGCGLWPDLNCKFFKWEDDVIKSEAFGGTYNLEEQNAILLEKIDKLKMKKQKLKESYNLNYTASSSNAGEEGTI